MPFDGFHPLNLIVILVIALLIFGPKKLPEMGKAIGQSIQMFRKGMSELTNPKTEDVPEETYLPAKTPEALRQELEELEREIALKKATLASQEVITPEPPIYHPETANNEPPVYHTETSQDNGAPLYHTETTKDNGVPLYHPEHTRETPHSEATTSTDQVHPEVTHTVHTPSETPSHSSVE
jgi:sec-independent protein translocase protein TatA